MSKFEKFSTIAFLVIALVGTQNGWLPGFWALVCVLMFAFGVDKYAISKLGKNYWKK